MSTAPTRIVILGGGFGGTAAALRLEQRFRRHAGQVSAKPRLIAGTGRRQQAGAMRPGLEGGTGLVEADVSVGSEAENHQVDAASRLDRPLVPLALRFEIHCHSVQEADAIRRQMRESFCDDSDAWRGLVYGQARATALQALRGLAATSP